MFACPKGFFAFLIGNIDSGNGFDVRVRMGKYESLKSSTDGKVKGRGRWRQAGQGKLTVYLGAGPQLLAAGGLGRWKWRD